MWKIMHLLEIDESRTSYKLYFLYRATFRLQLIVDVEKMKHNVKWQGCVNNDDNIKWVYIIYYLVSGFKLTAH